MRKSFTIFFLKHLRYRNRLVKSVQDLIEYLTSNDIIKSKNRDCIITEYERDKDLLND